MRARSGTIEIVARNTSPASSATIATMSQIDLLLRQSSASAAMTISAMTIGAICCSIEPMASPQATLSRPTGASVAAPMCWPIAPAMKRAVIGVPS